MWGRLWDRPPWLLTLFVPLPPSQKHSQHPRPASSPVLLQAVPRLSRPPLLQVSHSSQPPAPTLQPRHRTHTPRPLPQHKLTVPTPWSIPLPAWLLCKVQFSSHPLLTLFSMSPNLLQFPPHPSCPLQPVSRGCTHQAWGGLSEAHVHCSYLCCIEWMVPLASEPPASELSRRHLF